MIDSKRDQRVILVWVHASPLGTALRLGAVDGRQVDGLAAPPAPLWRALAGSAGQALPPRSVAARRAPNKLTTRSHGRHDESHIGNQMQTKNIGHAYISETHGMIYVYWQVARDKLCREQPTS